MKTFTLPIARTFKSLGHRNYKLFFFGQILSLPGNWIQNIALGWLVFRLTDSTLLLGVVGFAGQIPSLLVTPLAGVFADKLNRRNVLIFTQFVSMIIALALAFLILSNKIQVSHIIIASIINGIAVAIDNPFRQAFVINLIDDKKDLANAIALNSTLFNSARFIGPPIGGFLIAFAGEGICFLINGMSYLAVIGSLFAMRLGVFQKKEHTASILSDLIGGFKYAYETLHLRILIFLVIIISLLGLPFQVFMPVFAKEILHGDSQTLGFLTGALGAGALTGALLLANLSSLKRIPHIILISSLMFSGGLFAFTNSHMLVTSLITMVITGFGMVVLFASCNTLLQTMVNDSMRGRIISLYSMSFMGFAPIGSLVLGSLAESIGLQLTLSITALLCVVTSIWYYSHMAYIKQSMASY